MTNKFVKGPYKAEYSVIWNDNPEGIPVINDSGQGWWSKDIKVVDTVSGKEVATVSFMSHHSHYACSTIEEMEATANLLAAAPELFDKFHTLLAKLLDSYPKCNMSTDLRNAVLDAEELLNNLTNV